MESSHPPNREGSVSVHGAAMPGVGNPPGVMAAKWILIAVTCLLAAVPYIAGYLASSPDYEFQGAVDYVPDVQSYFMWMRSSADNPGLPPNLYHTTPEQPRFFHLLWWGLGKASRFTGISIAVLYHLTHVLGAFFFLLALWRFVGRFFTDQRQACLAFGVCVLGSGLGWCTVLPEPSLPPILRTKPDLPAVSLDLWSADVNTFYSILACPHYAVALWLLVEVLDRLYRAITTGDNRLCLSGAIFTLSLGFVHVYDMVLLAPLALVFSAVWRVKGRHTISSEAPKITGTFGRAASFIVAATLPALFYAIAVHRSPGLASWAQQNVLPTPGPHLYLQAFGVPAILMLSYWQAVRRIRRGEPGILFLVSWVGLTFLLMYSYPLLPFAKRVAEGVQIAIVILGVRCLYDQWIPWARARLGVSRRRGVIFSLLGIGLTAPTTLFLICNTTLGTTSRRPPFFVTGAERVALEELERRADKTKGIIALWQTANFLPRHTGMKVYVGHPHISPDYIKRGRLAQKFFWGYMSEAEMGRLLRENRIGYVWLERHKEKYDRAFPAHSTLFREWFRCDFVSVYEVIDGHNERPNR